MIWNLRNGKNSHLDYQRPYKVAVQWPLTKPFWLWGAKTRLSIRGALILYGLLTQLMGRLEVNLIGLEWGFNDTIKDVL